MGIIPPKSVNSRIKQTPWPKDQALEPDVEVLEPGDEGYEEAGEGGELVDSRK